MKTLLYKAQECDVIAEPFPHLIVRDALDEDLCKRLMSEFPSVATLQQGSDNQETELASNIRFHYLAKETVEDPQMNPLWKEFIELHTSKVFLQDFIRIFKKHICQLYPNFEHIYGSLDTFNSGVRKIDSLATADLLLDTLICVNTPVTTHPKSIRGAHIDLPDKLFAGLFYMRDPQDTSIGGDLELYRFKNNKIQGFRNSEVAGSYVECIKTVKYERNVLIIFLNSIHSLHGVTPRGLTEHPRHFVNLVGEVKYPLFNNSNYQEANHIKYWRKVKKLMNTLK